GADPGGWAWTDLPGGVPDADDTPGAILALWKLGESGTCIDDGLRWLTSLQNRDGGWPTFCRGWGHLPFDRSGNDLTAHTLRALAAWKDHILAARVAQMVTEAFNLEVRADGTRLDFPTRLDIDRATTKGFAYL